MNKQDKAAAYAAQISGVISTLFDEEGDYYIDMEDLQEGDNTTHFFHALANMVPTLFFNRLTGEDKNTLEFNHLANQLVFQYSNAMK